MSSGVRFTIVVSDETAAKAERQAAESGWTPEMWIAWLVEDYLPPNELLGEQTDE